MHVQPSPPKYAGGKEATPRSMQFPLPHSEAALTPHPPARANTALSGPDYTGVPPAFVAASQSGVRRRTCERDELVRPRVDYAVANVVPRAQPFADRRHLHERRRCAAARAAVHRRGDGAAWPAPGRRPRADALAQPRSLAAPARRQREGARRNLRAARAKRRPAAPRHAGRRMAARQLLPHRGRGAHGQAPPAARLQPRAAAHRRRRECRSAARLRPRAACGRPRRQQARPRLADALHRLVPDGQDAAARRAVGGADHAAPGADREPAARRGAGRGEPGGARSRGTLGRPHDRGRRARPEEPDPRRCRHGALGAGR